MNNTNYQDQTTNCVGEPKPQEEFILAFTVDASNNGSVVRINVGANKLASVIAQLSKRFYITIE